MPLKAIISGGGTGGHIFPAIAIANAIKAKHPDAEILFVGAKGRMEMEKVPAAGYPIEGLWISGLQRKLTIKNLSFPFKVISSLAKAKSIVKKFKPDVAIGVGGYASGPLLRVAARQGVKCIIQEQNSYPGITNKLLSSKVDKICVAYDGLERWFPKDKIIKTGNPVRKAMVAINGKREMAMTHFNLDPSRKTVFAMGGSLGAITINESLVLRLRDFKDKNIQLVWQCGKLFYEKAKAAAAELGWDGIQVHEFIKEMDLAYALADVILSRAGAMSISEISLVCKPSILVPLPHAAEDHQTHNARSLADKDAAILVADSDARNTLVDTAFELIGDEERLSQMRSNLKPLGIADSDSRIADLVDSLISRS